MLSLQGAASTWDPAPRFEKLFDGKTIPEPPTLLDDLKGRAKAVQGVRMVVGENMNQRDLGHAGSQGHGQG